MKRRPIPLVRAISSLLLVAAVAVLPARVGAVAFFGGKTRGTRGPLWAGPSAGHAARER